MRKYIIAAVLAAFSNLAWGQNFTFGEKSNGKEEFIEVDHIGIKRDGRYVIPVMGEIHYSRVPEREWRNEIAKMKAGGITLLSTYVFWSHHEDVEGQWAWYGKNNLRKFIQTCKEEDMPVVLRVGPFCHGEVYLGGMPEWLVKKAQENPAEYKLRSTAPGFIKATERLYQEIARQVDGLLWKDSGPVIGVQIENECRGPWSYYMALRDIAIKVGFDVPFMTRTGWPKLNGKEEFGKLLPLYGDYADGFWDRQLTDMPGAYKEAFIMKDDRMSRVIATETFSADELKEGKDEKQAQAYPYLTCELGGGMMPSYHRRINMSGNEAMPLAICKLGSGSNLPGYYMYHGGTNPNHPRGTMAECQNSAVTNYNDMPWKSYDFQCPLGEMGQPFWTAWHQTRWLHQFLKDWGEELAPMPVENLTKNYAKRGQFIFRNTYVRILNEQGVASVTPCGMKWKNLTISSETVQPFAKADNQLYFIGVPGAKVFSIEVNGKTYEIKPDRKLRVEGQTLNLLSQKMAEQAYVIDGRMRFAQPGAILYKCNGQEVEEIWKRKTATVGLRKIKSADAPRTVNMGKQKVAEQPSADDFEHAATYEITIPKSWADNAYDTFLEIEYKGDCARLYVGDELVQDNFWNGKTMLVRISDITKQPAVKDETGLANYKAVLRILPLQHDYPIYLQSAQRKELDKAKNGVLLELTALNLLTRVRKVK